jgi:signal transduction histidine kinase
MIFCQLLLVGFVIQWLVSQYKNEKTELQKSLAMQFEKSQQEVLDTLLEKNLINPLLESKRGFKISLDEHDTTGGKVKMFFNKIEKNDSTELVTVVTDTFISKNENSNGLNDSSKDILLHGVKLIVNEVWQSNENNRHFEQKIYSSSDTVLMRKHLEKNFKDNGWNFSVQLVNVINGDTTTKKSGKKMFYFESSVFPKTYGLEIDDYRMYLFKKIIPESIFALILLLLTGSAFILAHLSLKKQVRLNAMKNDFVDNISHELKTPLSTVKVVIEALQDENFRNDDKKMKEYLDMASLEIKRLELLTGKVLNTSMMESGKISLQKERIDLLKLISELNKTLRVRLTTENASVVIEAAEKNYFIVGDSMHIQGAILNIIDNSLKYSKRPSEIRILLSRNNKNVFIEITDNGPGIPEEYQDKVFDKFFRIPSGNLHNIKGHGLGLSYVSMVMKMHGGSVSVKNNFKEGCMFTLVFNESVESNK